LNGKAEVWLAVAGLRAISREITMPPVNDGDLDDAARLQALEIIPFSEDEALLSARSLGPVPGEDGNGQIRVYVAAAHRAIVEPLIEVLDEAGLTVTGVDLSSSALVRALADPQRVGVEAIVAVGSELTTIVVHEGGAPRFVRTIAGGGSTVTRAISGALDIPFPDAEQIKIRLGWSPTDAGRLPAEAVAAARDGSAALLTAIRSSIDYFATLPGVPEVGRIILTGGGSQLAGFIDRLGYQARVPVVMASWLDRIDTGRIDADRHHLESVGAVAFGIAIPESSGRKPLDLMPKEILLERKRARATRLIQAAAVVLVLALGGLGAMRFLQVRKAEKGVGSLNSSIAFLRVQIPKYNKVQQQDTEIVADSNIGLPLVSHEVNWPAVFAALAKYTPNTVSASGFSGSSSVLPSAVTTAVTGGAAAAGSPDALPPSTETLGTISLSFTGNQYPSFKQWFDELTGSQHFEIVSYSGVSSSTNSGVSFNAELAITAAIHTSRLSEFEVPKP
jgi:type IV pilus assembly protein PilM